MNELQIFNHPDFGQVRTVTINDEPWFVGKDVAQVLGYSNPSKAVISHVDDEDKRFEMLPISDSQNGNLVKTAILNESGLYSLIMSSKLPGAKEFKRWVTSEVLPSIRNHGAYMTPETLQAAILNPDTMIQLCQMLKSEQDKNRELTVANSRLTVENQIMQPKAEYFDELVDRNLLTNFGRRRRNLAWLRRSSPHFFWKRSTSTGTSAESCFHMRTRTMACLRFVSASTRKQIGAVRRHLSPQRAEKHSGSCCWGCNPAKLMGMTP